MRKAIPLLSAGSKASYIVQPKKQKKNCSQKQHDKYVKHTTNTV